MNALLMLMTALPMLTVATLWAHLIAFVKPDILEMRHLVPVSNVKWRPLLKISAREIKSLFS